MNSRPQRAAEQAREAKSQAEKLREAEEKLKQAEIAAETHQAKLDEANEMLAKGIKPIRYPVPRDLQIP